MQQVLEDARRLTDSGRFSEAKASLVVASCMDPKDASARFEHWRVCCLSGEKKAASRILEVLSTDDVMAQGFCALQLAELHRSVAVGGGECALVKAGWLEGEEALMNRCLGLLPEAADGTYCEEEIWQQVGVCRRAAEFAFRLDQAAATDREDGTPVELCTRWSGLLASTSLMTLLRKMAAKSEDGSGTLSADAVQDMKPMVERALLHHMGAGQWRQLRELVETFTSVAALPNFSGGNWSAGGLRCTSHAIALSVAQTLSSSSASPLTKHEAAVAYIALLGSFIEELFLYTHTCCHTEGQMASGAADVPYMGTCESVEEMVDETSSHGWFLFQLPPTQKEEDEPLAKKQRTASQDQAATHSSDIHIKPMQSSLANRLECINTLWTGLRHESILGAAGALGSHTSLWSHASWTWMSGLVDLHWHRGDHSKAAELLRVLSTDKRVPALDIARIKLQLAVCELMCGSSSEVETYQLVRTLVSGVLSTGNAAALHWYAQNATPMQEGTSAVHLPLLWAELMLQVSCVILRRPNNIKVCEDVQCVMLLLSVGGGDSSTTLVLSQVMWPRLGYQCLRCISSEELDVGSITKGPLHKYLFNAEVLERLCAVAKASSNAEALAQARALLGSTGGDPPCSVAEALREVLAV